VNGVKRDKLPKVSVIIPMRNEEQYISRCLKSIVDQNYPKELIEIIVVDGGSSDNSLRIVRGLMAEYWTIKLLGGFGVNCPAAMNIGIKYATGELISKIDAHGYAGSDFLRISAECLSEEEETKCVGGPIRPVAETHIAKANALARSSTFGVGKGIYSTRGKPQYVDTVQCGVYKRDIFGEVGLFDESLQFGEDEEINWRIRKRGYKIYITPEVSFFYFVRDSFGKLFKQYYNYGVARVKVIQKHPDFFRIKHVIPTAFIVTLFAAAILGIFGQFFLRLCIVSAIVYLIFSLVFSAEISSKHSWKYLGLLPISFAALHFGYGIGFAQGVCRLCLVKMSRKRRRNC
jgi:glycosyltransferase involved in cell wall biosynthesis